MSGEDIDNLASPERREHAAAASGTTGSHLITDPEVLRRAYERCRRTAAVHGRTYYLATRLLSAERRPAVHALYAFARMVDDIVDGPARRHAPAAVLDAVEYALRASWSPSAAPLPFVPQQLGTAVPAELSTTAPFNSPRSTAPRRLDSSQSTSATPLDSPRPSANTPPAPPHTTSNTPLDSPHSSATPPLGAPRVAELPARFDQIALALTDTVTRFAIDPRLFWTFLDSMRMDAPGSPLFRNRYPTMAALDEYMRGSAAAIGLQLLPVLGTVVPRAAAEPAAAALGNAFQLTNFLRDIGEDLDRDRIYLPADELAAFGVDEELLVYCHRTGSTDRRVRRALAHLIAVNRDLYRRAHPGIELLSPRVRPGIRTAATVYAAILERIEDSGYNVFARRAVVPGPRRLRLAAGAALRR
ncbi:squalene/phytoene synthase family protein [Nocardia flavorosea]|uniref:Squalene/phytoene synthase family protein n=1 Tax=Nocardia flavorosea TaxID=53429 RepID=A0A846YGI7_9NOCA|nr:squalene/phytoene synthase family protein [Nocardia flavorosea]